MNQSTFTDAVKRMYIAYINTPAASLKQSVGLV